MELAGLVTVMLLGIAMYGGIAWRERPERSLQTVELRFGTDVTADAVQSMLACVAGLPSNAIVLLDAVADENGIKHFLRASQQTLDTLRSQWRGVLPSLRMDPVEDIPAIDWTGGVLLRLSGRHPVLRSDGAAESAAAMLGAMQPLSSSGSECLLIRWLLAPTPHPALPQPLSRRDMRHAETSVAHLLLHEATPRADHLRLLRAKYAGPVLSAAAIVAVKAGHPKRAAHLVSRVVSVARSRGGAYGHVVVRRRGPKQIARLLDRPSLRSANIYAPVELVPLINLPIDSPRLPGLTLGTAPLLMPSPRIPSTGRVLAVSNWPGSERTLAQSIIGGLSHTLLAAPTGGGKSELIGALSVQDVLTGRGLFLLDGKGDTAESLLAHIPAHRQGDVVVLDPGAGGPLPGLRLFGRGADPELTADLVLGIFADLFKDSWGPLSSRWLRAGLLLLAHDETATLADFPFIFAADGAFRRRLIARLGDDAIARETWRSFEAMGQAERAHQLAAPLQKVEELIGRKVIRTVLGQSEPKLDMRDVLAGGKIVIVSLNAGKLGFNARLIAALALFKFFEAVQARAAIAPAARRPAFAYIDEPAIFADVPIPLDDAFSVARGLGVGLLLSSQSLAQLPVELRNAALTNAASLIAFGQNSNADARLLAGELGIEPEGLQHLEKFEAIFRIGLGPGDVAPPASGRTLPLPPAISDPEAIRRASAARYGVDPAEVDAALRARHDKPESQHETPVGRLRGDR